jgi:hypothetical protein
MTGSRNDGIDPARGWSDHRTEFEGLVMSDPNHHRSMNRMSMIVFVLAAIVVLLSIVYVRQAPAQDAPTAITRSL